MKNNRPVTNSVGEPQNVDTDVSSSLYANLTVYGLKPSDVEVAVCEVLHGVTLLGPYELAPEWKDSSDEDVF